MVAAGADGGETAGPLGAGDADGGTTDGMAEGAEAVAPPVGSAPVAGGAPPEQAAVMRAARHPVTTTGHAR